jgi:hypothetical protein
VLAHQRVGVESHILFCRQEARSPQLRYRLVPGTPADAHERIGQAWDSRLGAQARDLIDLHRAIEETDHVQDRHLRLPEPPFIRLHHAPRMPALPLVLRQRANLLPPPDIPSRYLLQVGPEQDEREPMPLVLSRRFPQLRVRALGAARPQQLGARLGK